jgi:microsomal dipeptidase-like Zn-dependent dipeptidase
VTAALLLLAVLALLALPLGADALLNRKGRVDLSRCSPAARALHERLWIADLHADSLLWGRDLLRRHRRGHVDLPRLLDGNVALQVFTVVSKMPFLVNFWRTPARTDLITLLAVLQRRPARTWLSLNQRARDQADRLHRLAEESGGRLVMVKSAPDLEALAESSSGSRVGALLGLEGAQVLEGKLENLDTLFQVGFRLLGLTHFFDNEVAGSAHGWGKGGLTPLGRALMPRMERLGMIVDLAHASAATLDEVTAIATRPVLVSHTGVHGTCDSARNLTDGQLERIAATGGLIGIAFFGYATGGRRVDAIVRAIRHTADRVGVPHVALGSDFDGAVRTPFDSSELLVITDALLAAGFGDEDVAAIMGENVRRFLRATLPR